MKNFFIWAYAGMLLVYTGWRTFDFMQSNLPKSDISFWLSIAFLFATEVGLIIWHWLNIDHVTTRNQQTISSIMVWADFAGSLLAGIADMILRQTFLDGYSIPPFLAQALIYGLPLVMAANVGSIIFYTSNDSEKQLEKSKRELRFEIYEAAMKELKNNSRGIATAMKRDIYSEIKGDVMGTVAKEFANVQVPEYVESNSQNNKPKTNQVFTNIKSIFTKEQPAMVSNNVEIDTPKKETKSPNFQNPHNGV